MNQVHPTAVVDPSVRLGGDVRIGPFAVIEEGVEIGPRCVVGAHSVVKARTVMGSENEVAEGAVLGGPPQHVRAGRHFGHLLIGNGNVIREHVTIHAGLNPGSTTVIGDRNYFMAASHVAHDSVIGHHVILANNVMLAGHVVVEDHAYLAGAAGAHQFCRIGAHAMVGGQAHLKADVPPYVLIDGNTTLAVGINHVGLRRSGLSAEQIASIKSAYRIVYDDRWSWEEKLAMLEQSFADGPASRMADFLRGCQRGIVRPRKSVRSRSLRVVREESGELRKAS